MGSFDFELTEGQKQAVRAVRDLVSGKSGEDVVIINGYAGTGKTTTLKIVYEEVGGFSCVAPTGKAALRVREATGISATTIHQWLYWPEPDPRTGDVIFKIKPLPKIEPPLNNLLVIEEASMVGPDVWESIRDIQGALGFAILIVGDEFQLPPVRKKDEPEFSLLNLKDVPTIRLTEVTRQALESPIIRATMDLRKGDAISALMDHGIPVIDDIVGEAAKTYRDSGMVLVHRNVTRHHYNDRIRTNLGFNGAIQPGEPLLVLKNNYSVGVYNGEVVSFRGWTKGPYRGVGCFDWYSKAEAKISIGKGEIDSPFLASNKEVVLVEDRLAGEGPEKIGERALQSACSSVFKEIPWLDANLGYCLTAHKAQGSEADRVLVCIEPSIRMHTLEGRRWLYTAASRARKELLICYV